MVTDIDTLESSVIWLQDVRGDRYLYILRLIPLFKNFRKY